MTGPHAYGNLKDLVRKLASLKPNGNYARLTKLMCEVDDLEAVSYRHIAEGRRAVIDALMSAAPAAWDDLVRDCLLDRLWLLDPSWDRATVDADMYEMVAEEFERVPLSEEERRKRIATKYLRSGGRHVIVEFKRHDASILMGSLIDQFDQYRRALRKCLRSCRQDDSKRVECVAVLGKPPGGYRADRVLEAAGIRYATYDQLVRDARRSYASYLCGGRTEAP